VNLARFSLSVVAVVFLGLGAMSLIAPTNLTALVEIAMPTRIAVMEVRGVYGGFFFGTGFFFLLFARHQAWCRPVPIAKASIFEGSPWVGRSALLLAEFPILSSVHSCRRDSSSTDPAKRAGQPQSVLSTSISATALTLRR